MKGKRTRRTRRRPAGVFLLLLLFAVLAAVMFARSLAPLNSIAEDSTVAEAVELTEYIQPTPMTPPMETPATPEPTPSPAATPSQTPEPEPIETAPPESRFSEMALTQEEIDMLAAIAFLEAGNQSAEGQQAVVEVVLNRVLADNFPDTVEAVIFQGIGTDRLQFTPATSVPYTTGNAEQYEAVNAALTGENILPEDVVYFSTSGENSRVWGIIGAHVFCRQYDWGR